MQRELVQRAIDGDREAFSDLVRAAASSQYALATLILRDRDRAQDAVQAGADDASMAQAERDRLERALGRLPIEQRAIIVLHYHLGLPLPEAVAVLDIPIGTAESRLHRCLEALRASVPAEPEVARAVQTTERLI
jgi:RNA polymerase sigma factor (sigma-70 family)